jgi:hypothetical protein
MKTKFMLNLLKILISILFIFLAGVLILTHIVIAIALLIIGAAFQIYDSYKNYVSLNKKIDGDGVSKISVSNEPPKKPKVNDLWIDTSNNRSAYKS